ncbi:MAG: hypothetical protein HY075_05875 [Deltaproteobacteria bacterium]|nr:hypothetical protein [Deltaproteobacteria bacterium]
MWRTALLALVALGGGARPAIAWENHPTITRASLQAYENWEPAPYEPIDKALSAIAQAGKAAPASVTAFCAQIEINCGKVKWDWQPPQSGTAAPTALDVLIFSSFEPDFGMDEDLDVNPDQKYMGGTRGPSSKGFRHMFYRAWTPFDPITTFHFPFHEMGVAPERAELFFRMARDLKTAGHVFWAYRVLGWGLHYVQDLGQPYHATQVASLKLMPLKVLMALGWEAFVSETTRIVGNFHLVFERYCEYLTDPNRGEQPLALVFKVPRADESLKLVLEQRELPIAEGARRLAIASSQIAAPVATAELALLGDQLQAPGMNVIANFFDEGGRPKVNFAEIEANGALAGPRKEMLLAMEVALSNTGVATRWYVDAFRNAFSETH